MKLLLSLLFVFNTLIFADKYTKQLEYIQEEIINNIKNYKNTDFGYSRYDVLVHRIEKSHNFVYQGKKSKIFIVVTNAKEEYCHGCQPNISFFVYSLVDGRYESRLTHINADSLGQYGKVAESIIIKLGKDSLGVLFKDGYANQGWGLENYVYFIPIDGKMKEVLSLKTWESDDGNENNNTQWSSTISYSMVNSPYYDIKVHSFGTKNGKKIDNVKTYKFKRNKYVLTEKED